jgi:hypothetical protein
MPRGKKAMRGHPARGGKKGGGVARNDINPYIAKPADAELPTSVALPSSFAALPEKIISVMPEFKHPQPFFSILERCYPEFAGSTMHHNHCWLGIPNEEIDVLERTGNSGFDSILRCKNGNTYPVFIKRIHLLDPIKFMEGEYVIPNEGGLPAPSDLWNRALSKINESLNEAYVDALFALHASRLTEQNISPHWCRCFGTFAARVDKYLFNITEEYSSLKQQAWWKRNQRIGLFSIPANECEDPVKHSRFADEPGQQLIEDDFIEVKSLDSDSDSEVVTENEPEAEATEALPIRLSTPKLRLKRIDDADQNHDDDTTDSCSESTVEQFAEFTNFPVQVTLLERADGTMEDLVEEEDDETMLETKEARWTAWLFQVIAALTAAQHLFGFVHNDLHTNNVMWSGTGTTFLYYKIVKGSAVSYMKVPTYGRIIKIIDFGRATYHLPDPCGFVISDAFFPGNDASTQYNCEPFYNPAEGKRVEPNTSFDLARLSVSLLESLYPERPPTKSPTAVHSREGSKLYLQTVSHVYNMLWDWLQDDDGKNILRGSDGKERYPDFELYRVLAAQVHKAIPKRQLERPMFEVFRCEKKHIDESEPIYTLNI